MSITTQENLHCKWAIVSNTKEHFYAEKVGVECIHTEHIRKNLKNHNNCINRQRQVATRHHLCTHASTKNQNSTQKTV